MSKKRYLTVYNLQLEKDWVLKNASNIIETQEINTVYSLEFTIPMNDDDMAHCQPYWYVRYGDDGQLYRFIDQKIAHSNESSVTYQCEHVIATLCDDVMFQGPYIKGNNGTYTYQVLNYILGMQTKKNGVANWRLGICQPRRQFEYSWENENLLAALFSVPTCFSTAYMWTYDTTSYPWTVNLVEINENADPDFYLMAKKNILQSSAESSNLDICTRLYGLGEGEGVNQLTIKSVNNGLPYIQSAPEIIAKYGIVSRIFVDRRFQYPETLLARMQTLLHELEVPTLKREFDIVDLYDLSPDDMYKAEVGRICLLKDDNTQVYITKTVKNHSIAGDMKITFATKATDMASSIADLQDRQRIEQVYSQGASQVYSFSFFGNATSDFPLDGYVYFPDDLKYLNEVKLKVMLKPFRSYSKASSGDGGSVTNKDTATGGAVNNQDTTSNGAVVNQPTEDGGAVVNQPTEDGGAVVNQPTEDGGAVVNKNTEDGGKVDTSTGEGGGQTGETSIASGGGGISVSAQNFTVTIKETDENIDWNQTPYTTTTDLNIKMANNGGHDHNVTINSGSTGQTQTPNDGSGSAYWHRHYFGSDGYGGEGKGYTDIQGTHKHDVWVDNGEDDGHSHYVNKRSLRHKHSATGSGELTVKNNEAGQSGFSHSHNFKIKAHSHPINIDAHSHKFSLDAHSHKFSLDAHSHKFSLDAHSHKFSLDAHSHKFSLSPHSHAIQPGIFESGNPTRAKIFIDDKDVNLTITDTNSEVNLTSYLLKNGSVPRGQWIKISVKPIDAAPNNMAYISVFGNTFAYIQSYTGGNF